MSLIPTPNLDIRNEAQMAAQAIGRTAGGLTADAARGQIASLNELLLLIQGGNLPSQPLCPELTNANPSAPHTVLLEAQAWLLAQVARKINQVPQQNRIEFSRLFGIELKAAAKATTTLRFTVAPVFGQPVTSPLSRRRKIRQAAR